jgi:ABC-type uncharacterized transport system ATPase subunit
MVKLIVGEKGSGKTKKLLDMVTAAANVSKGNVVCIEKGQSLRFDLKYHIRLIDITEYDVRGSDAYYGFISGLLAGNYDITEVFGDSTFKILFGKDKNDFEAMADFVLRVQKLVGKGGPDVIFSVSCKVCDIPERVREFILE